MRSSFAPRLLAVAEGTAVRHVVCVDGKPRGTITLEQLEASGDPAFGFPGPLAGSAAG